MKARFFVLCFTEAVGGVIVPRRVLVLDRKLSLSVACLFGRRS